MYWLCPVCEFQELSFSFKTARRKSLSWVRRKSFLPDDYVVQRILEEVCAIVAAVPIVNGEKRTFRPFCKVSAMRWLVHIEDN